MYQKRRPYHKPVITEQKIQPDNGTEKINKTDTDKRKVMCNKRKRKENNMKTTLIFAGSGETYLSVVFKQGEITHRNIKQYSTLYYADITDSDKDGFSVRFHLPYFRKFNKSGFISKQSALNYEQDILDAHFEEYLAEDPDELYENDVPSLCQTGIA